MNHILLSEITTGVWGVMAMGAVGIVVVFFLFIMLWASRYTKVGPNEVLIVSGRKNTYIDPDGSAHGRGFRIVKGWRHVRASGD